MHFWRQCKQQVVSLIISFASEPTPGMWEMYFLALSST